MPLLLDDLQAAPTAVKALTPKYFHPELTGNGKNGVGKLNKTVRPGRYELGTSSQTMDPKELAAKHKSSGSNVTTVALPMDALTISSVQHNASKGLTYPVSAPDDRYDVTNKATTYDFDVFLDLTPQGVVMTKTEGGDKTINALRILYRMEVSVLAKGSTSERVRVVSSAPLPSAGPFSVTDEFALMSFSYAPLDDVQALIADATNRIGLSSGAGVHVDVDELAEWMSEYNVHERISRQAEVWSSDKIAEIVSTHITELFANGEPDNPTLHNLTLQLRYLEAYNVSLSAYRTIHAAIVNVATPGLADTLSSQNLNLLMSHTLSKLDVIKPQLVAPAAGQASNWIMPPHFSHQQRGAICTTEPLTLVQAGAGTGKSTVILGRINHLEGLGVAPDDILVLSFTNAAADNIIARNPNVKSMTIARMIHDIYAVNHPTHELSSIDTIVNSIEIYFKGDAVARTFASIMVKVDKLEQGATTLLNAFIERYPTEVIAILDRLKQTCLELEIVLAYQEIETMLEPANVKAKYLIIDEVQDNSIFEFIYLLKYVAKHRLNMFIVGDASQTLFEFRASNPKALNALEESGVFATYQLTTNYRSNQEILDFANVHLADIEANATAGLRLQANSLEAPTAASFQEKVTLNYQHTKLVSKFREENLTGLLGLEVRPWVESRLAAGEQVAFLAYGRNDVAAMEKKLQEMFPQHTVANLVSEKTYSTTVFSQYIKLFWNDVLQVNPADASFVVSKGIIDNLAQLTRQAEKAETPVRKMVSDWWLANSADINGWLYLFQQGQLSGDDFFGRLRENILDFEIRHNSVKTSLMNQKNRERKERNLNAQAKLVVSTIHGAKGLEFDHVMVLHKYDSEMKEEDKRMYYVAFTRAMKSTYVLSYGNAPKPRIESDYELMVDALTKRDNIEALRKQGVDVAALKADEVELALAAMQAGNAPADVAAAAASFGDELAKLSPTEVDQVLHGSDEHAKDDAELVSAA